MKEYLLVALALLVALILGGLSLVVPRLRRRPEPPLPETEVETRAEEDLAGPPVEAAEADLSTGVLVEPPPVIEAPAPTIEVPEPTAGRLVRLRSRLSRSQNVFGKGLLGLLSREHLDEDAWEEIEDSLITADVGIEATREIVDRLRERTRVLGTRTAGELRALLAAELVNALDPNLDRSLKTAPKEGVPAVLLVVGVNGAGKTTTCGKIARVLIADGRTVLLGAADTFRAAAADQLETWGGRVGAETVRGPEAADPASVAFDAVKRGIDTGVDTVLVDTAGRLQNKIGLMDELGKVKRVVEKHGPIDETLLVLDATTGQNGLEQARVFTEVVNVTGVVLTKLDGTAKGGIVIAVQRKLGIPVKLVGLGEGPDDLAPFDPAQFVDALLGTEPLARDA
ncbi:MULTISPECIES: signal recognition particle-docking protein FtsY [Micromonospora]|uniref:Signal recognition particle receptor FtsY n=1 Tax=Micromonospora solifontis TaxID=2487138 RepID=A0ABX9WLJ4_9ACTN|nr:MULTISPECIES: signal recognition particle-docking protein FtsY [Micromonospora]NES16151.1 signal recognition particle-docking protein FtsY [Micromonospora sp. PPF5-17B]NES34861.1 signal recognition particle-docking protein FtsY [Micromonospora solifontis]NES57579.1 signal recognition particle-docking protein FtsY [Micromonospora sp. PPF5-6]RNM01432.1 signal recognition particle-docking protein FtsY [Micromonospora solifontis]